MSSQNTEPSQLEDRRKLLSLGGWGAIALLFTGFSFRKLFIRKKDVLSCGPGEKETYKMLTQDGRLVEIDAAMIKQVRKQKISDEELKKFVTPKQS
jgi:hypothetical protein